MNISDKSSTPPLRDYLTDLPGTVENGTQRALGPLAERTFENAEEARTAPAELVQHLFDQEIQRPLSAPPTKEPDAKRQRREPEKAETGIQNLDLGTLAHILSFLDPQSQGRAARVSRDLNAALRLRRILNLGPLHSPKFTPLLSLFGITLPTQPDPSSDDVSTACKTLLAKVSNILEGIKESRVLNDEEKKPFFEINPQNILQDPERLYALLHTAHEISLVAPFLNGQNEGPALADLTTLTEKAEAVRKHLRENRDRYTELRCSGAKMLCFPRELCSLQNIQTLDLVLNSLTTLPPEIGQLAQLQTLWAGSNQLTSLPPEIGQLAQLQTLSVACNQISSLPPQIGQLKQLQELWVNDSQLTSLPKEIGQLAQLQMLWVNCNQLKSLPAEIGQLAQLQTLGVSCNQLKSLPPEIMRFAKRISIYLKNNQLTPPPESTENIFFDT